MPITVTLLSNPDYTKEISFEAAQLCGLMMDMLGSETEGELPMDTVSPAIMDRVLAFLHYHAANPFATIETPIKTNKIAEIVGEWDAEFMDLEKDQETMVDLILAANYLNCQSLLNLGILKLACMIKDKEPDQVKEMFNIEKDITPEEEKQVREANMWVFDIGEKKVDAT